MSHAPSSECHAPNRHFLMRTTGRRTSNCNIRLNVWLFERTAACHLGVFADFTGHPGDARDRRPAPPLPGVGSYQRLPIPSGATNHALKRSSNQCMNVENHGYPVAGTPLRVKACDPWRNQQWVFNNGQIIVGIGGVAGALKTSRLPFANCVRLTEHPVCGKVSQLAP